MSLLKKIGMSVQVKLSLVEKGRLEFDRRGVDKFWGENVPDIGGIEKYLAGVKGLVGTLIDISQLAVTNFKNVDLQRVDRLKSVLPPFLRDGSLALLLTLDIIQIDVQSRPFDQNIADETYFDQRSPVNARAETLNAGDRRVRIRILDEDEII